MNCRKCGCEILETDERCPMCDARQRSASKKPKNRNASDSGRVKKGDGISKRGIIVLVLFFCITIAFVIFHFNLLNLRRPSVSITEVALFINRIDGHTTGHHGIQMTEDRIYTASHHGDVIVFDHNMTYVETINIDGEILVFDDERNHTETIRITNLHLDAYTLYVADDSIYFISWGRFLRYDFDTEIVELIADITGFQYVPGPNGQWHYFNDPFNEDRFFYIDDVYGARNLYEVNILEEERNLIASDVETLAIIPDYLIIASRQGIYLYHEQTSERSYLDFDFARFGTDNSITTGGIFVRDDDLFILDGWDDILYHKTLSGGYVREIANDIWWFGVVGNYIIYQTTDWGDLNIYVMDLEGNNIQTLISYE